MAISLHKAQRRSTNQSRAWDHPGFLWVCEFTIRYLVHATRTDLSSSHGFERTERTVSAN